MKEITKLMIAKYQLMKLKYDFLGYEFNEPQQLSFHHLIIPHRNCKAQGLGDGYYEWNGAILVQNTSHDYLHVVERTDYDMFMALTSEMIDENVKGFIDMQNLEAINDVLECFEREYCGKYNDKGYPIIKPKYVERRLVRKK